MPPEPDLDGMSMRLNASLYLALSLLLISPALGGVPSAAAQDDEFGDAFDDEFGPVEEDPAPAPEPTPEPAEPEPTPEPAPGPSDDEFGDAFEEPAPAPAPAAGAATGTAAAAEGDALDADLADDELAPEAAAEASAEGPEVASAEAAAGATVVDEQVEERVSEPNAEERAARERRHVLHNSWYGPVGGFRTIDAGSGAPGAFRAQLGINFFLIDGWLTTDDPDITDSNDHVGGALSLSWTPFDFLELYGSLVSFANSNAAETPELIQVLGDITFGVKGFYSVLPWLTVGGDVGVAILNSTGDIGVLFDSTSWSLRGNATADLRELEDNPLPIISRLNLQYYFDNSSRLIRQVEEERLARIPDSRPCPDSEGNCQEDRHLVSRIERYALQIDRVDRFTLGVGFEFPLTVAENVVISPILEWVLNIPVNRQNYSCLFIEGPEPGRPPPGEDGCLDRQGFRAFEQALTLGVKVQPFVRGLNLFAAVDIGLTGTYTFVRELSGIPPYNVLFGAAFAFDTQPIETVRERVVTQTVEVAGAAPRGRIVGSVVAQGTGDPVTGAVVTFPGRELSPVATDEAGRFRSYSIDPEEEVELAVSHPEYRDGACSATLPEDGTDVQVECALEAAPRTGGLRGTVSSEAGPVAGASVRLRGPASRTLRTGPDGTFNAEDLPAGEYTARVEAEDYLVRQDSFTIAEDQPATPEINLTARPSRPLVTLGARTITLRRQVRFGSNSARIQPSSTPLLAEIADLLLSHPEIQQVEIEGHTDNRGGRRRNQELSQRRADAVRDWLIRAGVEASRLTARGYGQTQPRVPNITASNRARNRRIELTIRRRVE